MEEKDVVKQEEKSAETSNNDNALENNAAEDASIMLKEALADYILARMPKEMADSLKRGKTVGEIMAQMENSRLKKENEDLKLKLEKTGHKPLTLAGEGGENEKDPFALGFMQAFNNY